MSNDADYHRTFEKFVSNALNMWPEFKRTTFARGRLNDRGSYPVVEEIAKRSKAFHAYQRVGEKHGLQQIRLMPKYDQDFESYATEWEDTYSTLTWNWKQRVEPVVDDQFRVAGHYGWWRASEILFPAGVSFDTLDRMVAQGVPMFANQHNPMPAYWRTAHVGAPEWKYLLLTNPVGRIESIFAYDVGSGAVATMSPWEAIAVGRAGVALVGVGVKAGRRVAIGMFKRGNAAGAGGGAGAGPTKEIAEAAGKRAAAPAPQPMAASGTVKSVHVGTFNTPGHVIARIEVEEGKVVYRVAGIDLTGAKQAAARAAHRNMVKQAAQEAQKRGQTQFTYRGIEANPRFRGHADEMASKVGVPGSGREFASSSGGLPNYEVTLDAGKVLSSQAAKAAPGAAAGAGAAK